jgi:uncharacterized protein with HEPN domain
LTGIGSLSSRGEPHWLADIVEHIDQATEFLADLTPEELERDRKTAAAVERALQCVTEAAIRVGNERMAVIAPDVPMRKVRDLGNRLRHAYESIDLRVIHATVLDDLPALRARCVAALEG